MAITVNDKQYELVFAMEMDVRWGEMDALGHVNNVAYFRYFEDARLNWMQRLGVRPVPGAEGFVLAQLECHFRRAIVYPERLVVLTYVGELGRSNVPMYQEIRSATDREVLYAYGENRVVWIDQVTGKPRPVPEPLRERLLTPLTATDRS